MRDAGEWEKCFQTGAVKAGRSLQFGKLILPDRICRRKGVSAYRLISVSLLERHKAGGQCAVLKGHRVILKKQKETGARATTI